MILKHFTKNNENHKNPFPPRLLCFGQLHTCTDVEASIPCVLVGNSNGAFLAQIVASRLGLPALLGNPYLEMTRFLSERIGEHEYKSPRTDGHQHFIIDQSLIEEFADVQVHQWDAYRPELDDRIWGLFGENDHLAHFEPLSRKYYTHVYRFPGAHTPTAEEVREYYAPLTEELMQQHNNK